MLESESTDVIESPPTNTERHRIPGKAEDVFLLLFTTVHSDGRKKILKLKPAMDDRKQSMKSRLMCYIFNICRLLFISQSQYPRECLSILKAFPTSISFTLFFLILVY